MKIYRKNGLAVSAVLLCLGGIICKVIGALYKIPLTNVLGAEGIGLYQTVFPVFSILLSLTSGGISQTVSAMTSSMVYNEKNVVKSSLLLVSLGGSVLCVLLYLLAPYLSAIQNTSNLDLGYKALIPAILSSGYCAVFRGYFQAKNKVFPTFISQITEQSVKLISGLFLSVYLLKYGLIYGVVGALIGISISEVVSLIYLVIRYALKKKERGLQTVSYEPISFSFIKILKTVLPLAIGGLVMPISSFVDSVSIVNVLSLTLPLQEATSRYGLMSGTVATLTSLPTVFTVALGIVVLPALSKDKTRGKLHALCEKGRICVKLTLFICIPVTVLFIVSSRFIIGFLYPNLSLEHLNIASILLSISALGITGLGVSQIYSSLLFSLSLSTLSVRNLTISVAVKCALIYPVVHYFGIYGACALNVLCYTLSCILNARTWKKIVGKNTQNYKLPTISIITILLSVPLFFAIPRLNTFWVFALFGICVVLYLYISILAGVFSKSELMSLPFGKTLAKIKNFRSKK